MMGRLSLLLIVFYFISLLSATNEFNCTSFSTCSLCISAPTCYWCAQPGNAYCSNSSDSSSRSGCNSTYIVQYVSNVTEINEEKLSDDVQVSLKSINVNLKVGDPLNISFLVKASDDYPLDLYMLMDLSFSFKDDLNEVKMIAPQLSESLRNVSSSFQIGFGAFVDKPVLPFTSNFQINRGVAIVDGFLVQPPFGYEHIVSLTNSSELFNTLIQNILISTNVDNPEGALDAMLQVIVCDDVIGWREDSRKILLVMTDDTIHTAGDGTLAGIIRPNDGQCHTVYDPVTNRTLYEAILWQDYPSVELIRSALFENDIVPVFAISGTESSNLLLYKNIIAPLLNGFTVELSIDSSNLIDVLKKAYAEIVSSARLSFALPSYISATVTANCTEYNEQNMECHNISSNITEFVLSLTLQECTQKLRDGQNDTITVNIPGFQRFTITVTGQCSCDCETESIALSDSCTDNGNLTCGICNCNEGWTGDTCSCSTNSCPLGLNGLTCNGPSRGVCTCGQCECIQPANGRGHVFGSACECSDFECPTDANGNVCSGLGNCECSNGIFNCNCHTSILTGIQRTGDRCQCSTDHCLNSVQCSGHGTCNPCNPRGQACTCNMDYAGPYCGESTFTGSFIGLCNADRECVQCYGEGAKNGNTLPSCGRSCVNYTTLLNTVQNEDEYDIPGSVLESTSICTIITQECRYEYYVGLTTDRESIYQVPPPSCLPIPIWAIAVLWLVVLILIGICILIAIKCTCIYLDHREFSKFQVEVSNASSASIKNPMHQEPAVTYENVAYGTVSIVNLHQEPSVTYENVAYGTVSIVNLS